MTSASPPRPSVDASADLKLFATQTMWVAPHLPEANLGGVIAWLAHHLSSEVATSLRTYLLLDHPRRIQAEALIASVLSSRITRQAERWHRSNTPLRGVDWPRSYLEALGARPSSYWCKRRATVLDRSLQSALTGIARAWSNGLILSPRSSHQTRAMALSGAIQRSAREVTTPVGYGRAHESRLLRVAPEAAKAIRDVAALPWARLSTDGDNTFHGALHRLGCHLVDTNHPDKMLNSLLEVSVQLTILESAIRAPADDCPGGKAWSLEQPPGFSRGGPKYVTGILRSGSLYCEVSKGAPKASGAEAPYDRLGPLRALAGLTHQPRQPDLRLSFWLAERPGRRVFALGDAKRNTGPEYVKSSLDVAALYLVAYSDVLQLALNTQSETLFEAPLHPAFTLFFRHAPGQVKSVHQMVRELRAVTRPTQLPPILPLFMTPHFDASEDRPADHPSSPVVAAWLGALARQALRALSR